MSCVDSGSSTLNSQLHNSTLPTKCFPSRGVLRQAKFYEWQNVPPEEGFKTWLGLPYKTGAEKVQVYGVNSSVSLSSSIMF